MSDLQVAEPMFESEPGASWLDSSLEVSGRDIGHAVPRGVWMMSTRDVGDAASLYPYSVMVDILHRGQPSEAYRDAVSTLREMPMASDDPEDAPSEVAVRNAGVVLEWVQHHALLMVYPSRNGGVAVDAAARGEDHHRAILFCHGDGSGLFLEQRHGTPNWRSHCDDATDDRMRGEMLSAVGRMNGFLGTVAPARGW